MEIPGIPLPLDEKYWKYFRARIILRGEVSFGTGVNTHTHICCKNSTWQGIRDNSQALKNLVIVVQFSNEPRFQKNYSCYEVLEHVGIWESVFPNVGQFVEKCQML